MSFTKIELSPDVLLTCEKMARVMTNGHVEKFLSIFITGVMESVDKALTLNLDLNDLEIRFPADTDQ